MSASKTLVPIPKAGEGKRGEEGYLSYLLRQAAAAYRHSLERSLADLGVTPPQYSLLIMLAAYPGHCSADLARVALLTPQTVSVIIANLEKAGAIARRPHSTHGRIQEIEILPAGRKLLARCHERASSLDKDLNSGLNLEEKGIVKRWLVAVAMRETNRHLTVR